MNYLKAWSWNSEHYGSFQPIIFYNNYISDKQSPKYTELQSIVEIFKESSKHVYPLERVNTELIPQIAV